MHLCAFTASLTRRRWATAIALVAVATFSTVACELASPAGPTASVGEPARLEVMASFSAELSFCANEINRYRATIARPALRRSEALEVFAARGAEYDATIRIAHAHFRETNGGGIARAETEILWWRGHAVRQVIQKGLAQMWQVGPGGEHYEVLAGPYSEVGCGIYVSAGEVTVAQAFR